jgi:hypothetical protein
MISKDRLWWDVFQRQNKATLKYKNYHNICLWKSKSQIISTNLPYNKKICKNKKYFPTMSAKESALIPTVKNLNRSTNIITTNTEYTIDPQSEIEETTLSKYKFPNFPRQGYELIFYFS